LGKLSSFVILLEFTLFSQKFPKKNHQVAKFSIDKNVEGGVIQLFNAKISPNYVAFIFTKEVQNIRTCI
jgi:hypothetical protein